MDYFLGVSGEVVEDGAFLFVGPTFRETMPRTGRFRTIRLDSDLKI